MTIADWQFRDDARLDGAAPVLIYTMARRPIRYSPLRQWLRWAATIMGRRT